MRGYVLNPGSERGRVLEQQTGLLAHRGHEAREARRRRCHRGLRLLRLLLLLLRLFLAVVVQLMLLQHSAEAAQLVPQLGRSEGQNLQSMAEVGGQPGPKRGCHGMPAWSVAHTCNLGTPQVQHISRADKCLVSAFMEQSCVEAREAQSSTNKRWG